MLLPICGNLQIKLITDLQKKKSSLTHKLKEADSIMLPSKRWNDVLFFPSTCRWIYPRRTGWFLEYAVKPSCASTQFSVEISSSAYIMGPLIDVCQQKRQNLKSKTSSLKSSKLLTWAQTILSCFPCNKELTSLECFEWTPGCLAISAEFGALICQIFFRNFLYVLMLMGLYEEQFGKVIMLIFAHFLFLQARAFKSYTMFWSIEKLYLENKHNVFSRAAQFIERQSSL